MLRLTFCVFVAITYVFNQGFAKDIGHSGNDVIEEPKFLPEIDNDFELNNKRMLKYSDVKDEDDNNNIEEKFQDFDTTDFDKNGMSEELVKTYLNDDIIQDTVSEVRLKKNTLIKTIPIVTPYYEVSFSIKPLSNENRHTTSIIHFTTGGNTGRHGFRNPAVWMFGGTRLHVCTTISNSNSHCWNTPFNLPLKKFSHITLRQEAINGNLHFFIFINEIEVARIHSNKAYTFRNVKVYAADPWHNPANVVLKNLNFKNLIKPGDLIQKNRLIETHKVLTPYYEISFEIKPITKGGQSVIHLTTGGNTGNGGRIPAVFLHSGNSRMKICSWIGKSNNRCWNSNHLPYDKFTNVSISQRAVNGKVYFSVVIDGNERYKIENTIPRTFHNVKVFNGDNWHPPAEAVLRNYKFKQFEKPIATLSKGRIIDKIDFESPSYEVTFDIKPLGRVSGWTNILHLTTGNNGGNGGRIPAVFLHSGSSRMLICSMINNNHDYCWNSNELPFGKYSHIKICQRFEEGKFVYKILIDGKEMFKIPNNTPRTYTNVIVYAADNWYNSAQAVIKNFKFKNVA